MRINTGFALPNKKMTNPGPKSEARSGRWASEVNSQGKAQCVRIRRNYVCERAIEWRFVLLGRVRPTFEDSGKCLFGDLGPEPPPQVIRAICDANG